MATTKHFEHASRFSAAEIRRGMTEVEGFNAKLAVLITHAVGTMACAYAFGVLALLSLPAALATGQLIIIVAWIAQTFLQLVLLSIIMVGQRVQAVATDARAEKEFVDIEKLLTLMDASTEGGLGDILAAIEKLKKPISKPRTTRKSL